MIYQIISLRPVGAMHEGRHLKMATWTLALDNEKEMRVAESCSWTGRQKED